MELFTDNSLKRKYEVFVSETILKIIDCNYCNKTSCFGHRHFDSSCSRCEIETCFSCKVFNQNSMFLMEKTYHEGREFIFNFASDFYRIRNHSLNFFYKSNKKNRRH